MLGANDSIVSTAGIVLGVAGATASKESIVIAGVAGLVSGAISMAAGEFVSVSSQRDSERAFLARRHQHISEQHTSIAEELVEAYQKKGLSKKTAELVAGEYKAKGLLTRELERESGLDPEDISNPWSAAIASAVSFVIPLNDQDEKGQTPVMIATYNNDYPTAKVLIEAGADVNIRDTMLNNPFLYAGAENLLEILRLTVDHGADVNIADKNGVTPLQHARAKGFTEIVRILQKAGAR